MGEFFRMGRERGRKDLNRIPRKICRPSGFQNRIEDIGPGAFPRIPDKTCDSSDSRSDIGGISPDWFHNRSSPSSIKSKRVFGP